MRLLAFIGVVAILVVIGVAVFFFGGFYNVAASVGDPGFVRAALSGIRESSIERQADMVISQMPTDAASVQAGARAFLARGCVNCHGAPGVKWAKFSEGLNPDPPDLRDVANEAEPTELFWVIKHGIKMTGMPSFGAVGVPDKEIWTIVAFVHKLPTITAADFKNWTSPPAPAAAPGAPAGTPPARPAQPAPTTPAAPKP